MKEKGGLWVARLPAPARREVRNEGRRQAVGSKAGQVLGVGQGTGWRGR